MKKSKFVKKQSDGSFKVNKLAIIARLVKARKETKTADISLIEVPIEDMDAVHSDMSRYNADNLLNHSEE